MASRLSLICRIAHCELNDLNMGDRPLGFLRLLPQDLTGRDTGWYNAHIP